MEQFNTAISTLVEAAIAGKMAGIYSEKSQQEINAAIGYLSTMKVQNTAPEQEEQAPELEAVKEE